MGILNHVYRLGKQTVWVYFLRCHTMDEGVTGCLRKDFMRKTNTHILSVNIILKRDEHTFNIKYLQIHTNEHFVLVLFSRYNHVKSKMDYVHLNT